IHARFWSLDTPSRQFVEDRETSVKTGTIHYRHVTPGEYRLSIELASSVGDLRFADATVRISSGETVTLPVAVPALHRLKLRFPDGYRRPRVFIRGGDTELILRRILEPQVELRLPEGVYEVVEPAPGEREGGAVLARFRVPATEEVEIPRRER
ncbi:MAG TPA: hypothetical protein VK116_20055, partial [Planctomycetota bacterium]|nr:hypothetical protein [Planctomycetota bacterium]